MKLYKLLILIAAIFGILLFTACEEDDFLNNAGSFDVKNLNVSLDGILAYDAPDLKTATLTFANGSETQAGAAFTEARLNDGNWASSGASVSVPGELQVSLNDFLSIMGLSFADVTAGDVAEMSWMLGDTFRGGITTIPITCSTDAVLSNVSSDLFLPTDSLAGEVTYDIDVVGPANISDIDVTVSYDGADPVKIKSISSWPSSESLTLEEVLNTLGLTQEELELGKSFLFEFVLNSDVGCKSANTLSTTYACPSNLEGTYEYTSTTYWCDGDPTTGEVTWTSVGPGIYEIDNWSYGTYTVCYGGPAEGWGTLQLSDVCNGISIIGLDAFDDTWTIKVESVDGPVLTISWGNTYGESGTVELTRTDDTDWPPLF